MSNETLDEPGVLAKFSVRADQVLDLLTLTGDTVDNVPGVPKVGPKTAAKWLAQYETLDNILAHAGEIPGVVGENLRATIDWLPQGRKLLTVKTDCELPLRPTDLAIAQPDMAVLKPMYERFEFKSWLRDLPGGSDDPDAADAIAQRAEKDTAGRRWDTNATDASAVAPAAAPIATHYEMVRDEAALARWLAAIDAAELDALDTETTSLDPMQAHIVGVSLAVKPASACYIPLAHRYAGAPDQLDRDATLRRLAPWLADPTKRKLGQNLKYDQHALANDGLALGGVAHDTLLESYVIESHKPHDMGNLASRHLNVKTIRYDDVTGKGAEAHSVRAGGDRARDGICGRGRRHHVAPASTRCIRRLPQTRSSSYIYAQIEMPVREVLFRMERNGILIDARTCSRGRAASWASGWWRSNSRRTSLPASRSTSVRRSNWARFCSSG